jgi:acetyl-CoA decarbonylase/synthase complex subunit beta
VKRVFLHSLQDYPHTNCGCFENIAFKIEEIDGMGVMHRGFDGVSPEGRGWDSYANEISGRQYPGAAGVSTGYLLSREFLQGDGGHGKIVWMTRKLRDRLLAARPGLRPIATEEEVSDLRGLEAFLKGRR